MFNINDLIANEFIMNNKIRINVCASIILQIVSIICGFIAPRLILTTFGSDVNGLISSITQFLNYVQLLEGGIGSVIMAKLYKPLREHNNEKLNAVVCATNRFFKQLACIYLIYVAIVGFVYPLVISTGFSYRYSMTLIFVLASNLFVQYFFSISFKLLLNADRNVYIVSFTQVFITIINTLSIYICIKLYRDILFVKLVSALIYLIQPVVFNYYVKKKYIIDLKAKPDEDAMKHRWDGLGINTAFFIHSNTDIVLLTFLSTLANVSVYSVYFMIVKAVRGLVTSVSSAISPSMGNVVAGENLEKSNKAFDSYEFGIFFITTIAFTSCLILLTPFIDVYTKDIVDANYHQLLFGIILSISEMIYCYRDPYIAITYAAGHIKQIAKYAYIEALINIVISIVLIQKLGLVGIAIGTTMGMLFRLICHIIYLQRNILMRNMWCGVKNLVIFSLTSFLIVLLSFNILDLSCTTYFSWMLLAFKVGLLSLFFTLIVSLMFYRNQLKIVIRKFI